MIFEKIILSLISAAHQSYEHPHTTGNLGLFLWAISKESITWTLGVIFITLSIVSLVIRIKQDLKK